MRELAITGVDRVEVIEYKQDRPLKDREVLIRTEIASGKHGTGLNIFKGGDAGPRGPERFDESVRMFVPDPDAHKRTPYPNPNAPWNVGTSGIGRVEKVGDQVTRWKVGDRVCGLMGIRETNIIHEDWLWSVDGLDELSALCMEPGYVAFHSVRESNVRFGEKVLVVGLGAIGLMAVKMAKESGALQVIAVDKIARRRELALQFGADIALDPADGDAAYEVKAITGGSGVDIAIEVAGAYQALDTAIRSTRVGGTVCAAGAYRGEAHTMMLGREFHLNRLTMVVPHGCGWGHEPRDYPAWTGHRAYDTIISMMRMGRLQVGEMIDPIVSIEDGPQVYDMIAREPEKVMKFAVKFDV